jgi:L-ascorbate metabolism protein UlaG (beta-lactamase superfamily)
MTFSTAEGELLFIGTATTLIRFGEFTLLTDPNFLHRGDEVHIGYGLRSRRLTEPALDLAELPQVDLVLLSHFHEDHFDRLVAERLDHGLPILTTGQAAAALRDLGFGQARELDTWQSWAFRKGDVRLRITALPAQHTPLKVMQPLLPRVMGSLLTFSSVDDDAPLLRVYVSGDTLLHDALYDIPRRFPDIDLGLFHLGGTRVFGVLLTMDARQGVEAVRIVAPRRAIPIHYDDYDVFKSPLDDFRRAVDAAGLTERVDYLERGERYPLRARAARLA